MLQRSSFTTTMTRALPFLSVQPTRALVDEKVQVVVKNLTQGLAVTLHSLHQSEDNDYWEAFGHYISDDSGTVTVSKDASVGGTYQGVESMGLLWSMVPVPGSRPGLRLRKKDVLSPLVVLMSVYEGHLSEGFMKQLPLSTVCTERWYTAPGVRRIDLDENSVKGTLFLPPGPGPFPGVLDMWGGGGGLVEYRAALLASHGFVTLALQYLSAEGAGTTKLEQSYFEGAYRIVQEHPLVLKDRVALLGLSFGTSVALNMAVYSKVIRPRCCVCISGSHILPINKPTHFVLKEIQKNINKTRLDEEGRVIWKDIILPIPSDPDMKVDVGKIKCPLLLVVGEDDQNWPTCESAEDISMMMHKAGNEHLLTLLSYPGAGHLIEPPYTPHFRASNFIVQHSKEKVIMLWGGQPKPHADAQEDSWEKILAFLQQHLYHGYDSAPQAKL
ncbi:acyl-CoA thioesterase 18 isoform X1 [Hypomesus transpacificus]|uniref:acyl-CoA thioesterase 18 isoform X1 n=1 Tax=Hypomesus transpacificus TaxID=137520 RepID=UPI001F0828D2|nr:acyl-CoA thioesterase 18 isoform X1 [Hypomesus transpacificus]